MKNWKNLDIQDKKIVDEFVKDRFNTSDYNFTNIFIWSKGEEISYKVENDILYLKGKYEEEEYYFMPIPKNIDSPKNIEDWKAGIRNILDGGYSIVLVPENYAQLLKDEFVLEENRDSFDYIYNSEDLAFLKGRKFAKKKNKISNFKKLYSYTYERINKDNIEDVIAFQMRWCQNKECSESTILRNEHLGIVNVLKNFDSLDCVGGVLKVDENIVAYAIGEVLNSSYGVVHIEKGINEIVGSYQMINLLFAENELLECKFINREDDFGNLGLREAKNSYHPVELLKKYDIISKKTC